MKSILSILLVVLSGLLSAAPAPSIDYRTMTEAQKNDLVINILGSSRKSTKVAATIVSKSGSRTDYVAAADTDAARGTALTNALLAVTSGQTLIAAPGDYYMATLNLLIVDGVTYQWNGARLYINSSSAPRSGGESALNSALFTSGYNVSPTSVGNWSFVGPLVLDGGSVSGKVGLWPIRGGNQLVTGVTFKNWAGNGFKSFLATDRGNRMSDCYFTGCGIGAEFQAEYWTVSNSTFHANATGVQIAAGNTSFSNCAVTYNTAYGVKIMNASNGGHASWVGGNVNHHNSGGAIGVYVDPALTTFSFSFVGCQFHLTGFDLNGMGIDVLGGECRDVAFTMSGGTPAGVSHFRNVRYYTGVTTEATTLSALGATKRAKIKIMGWRDENDGIPSFEDRSYQETWVFEGDSWTAGTAQGNDRECYPYYIGKFADIANRVQIVNVATNGQTANQMVGTFSAQVAPNLTATTGRPSTAFIFAGINDGGSRTTTQVRDDLRTMWTAARNAGAKVVAFTLPHRTAGGGWSQADWATVNAQIIADSSYYDFLVRTDIAFPNLSTSNTALTSDGLHVLTGAQASFAAKVIGAVNGKTMIPVIEPNFLTTSGNDVTFTTSQRNLPFNNPLVDAGADTSYQTIGSDANTMVFTVPVDGWYEIAASSCIGTGGLTAGDQAQMSAWYLRGGTSTEMRLDFAYASGSNLTLKGQTRRALLRGDQIYISITTTRSGVAWKAGPVLFGVRFLSN